MSLLVQQDMDWIEYDQEEMKWPIRSGINSFFVHK